MASDRDRDVRLAERALRNAIECASEAEALSEEEEERANAALTRLLNLALAPNSYSAGWNNGFACGARGNASGPAARKPDDRPSVPVRKNLRAFIRREWKNEAGGFVQTTYKSVDFAADDLRNALTGGGYGECGYGQRELLGVEVLPTEETVEAESEESDG